MQPTVPERVWRGSAELCCLVTATEPEGTAMSCVRGGGIKGRFLTGGRWVQNRLPGQGHSTELLQFSRCLDNARRCKVQVVLRGARNWPSPSFSSMLSAIGPLGFHD